jgi:hypothetical protein
MCTVTANNKPLHMPDGGTYSLNMTLGEGPLAVHLDWQLFRNKLGNSIEISSGNFLSVAFQPRQSPACHYYSALGAAAEAQAQR